MTTGRPGSVTRLARTIDLSSAWNASDGDVAGRFHPLYEAALGRLPSGPSVFRGLPFGLGTAAAGRRWILVDDEVTIDLRAEHGRGDGGRASHLVVAHFADSWRDASGERPPGTPVGWVLPTGEPLVRYEVRLADGATQATDARRRFEIADGIIGWGFLPFAAVGHRADETVDWRGPHPRQEPGRYAPAGHAGPLTMLPGTWGPAQSGVADFVPTPDDDVTLWLHAIPLDGTAAPVGLRVVPLGDGRAGSAVVIAALTLFDGNADPLALTPRRQLLVRGTPPGLPTVDLGVAVRTRPAESASAIEGGPPIGWGRPRTIGHGLPPAPDSGRGSIVDLVTTPDARLRFGDWEVAIADLDDEIGSSDGRMTIRPLPEASTRVDIRVSVGGTPTPARVRFVAADGRYLPPQGHREEVNPGLCEDSGADMILGRDTYAYVPGRFQIDLPVGDVFVEVIKGFDHRPVRRTLRVEPGLRNVAIDLERVINLERDGWRSSDTHVHYLSPSTALLQAAAEDVTFVHLLATQWGDNFTNIPDLTWGSQSEPSGRHAVMVGTENRQNMLGHLALLGASHPVMPLAAGGSPEGRLGGAVTELLADWADRCHAAGGLVVGAHFPGPYAEIAAAIVSGRIDAVEMQCLAPGLDSPPITEWYRFLNCGYRLPILGGTDKMTAEIPVGAVRTYARLDPDLAPTFDAWAAAVRGGRTFVSSGPVIELAVDGREPGDVLSLPSSGGRLEVHVRARAAQPVIVAVELVINGRVVAGREAEAGTDDLELLESVEVTSGAWIAARARSGAEIHSAFATSMAAHSSPVYVEVPGRPVFAPDDAVAIQEVMDGTLRWVRDSAAVASERERARMVEQLATSATLLRDRFGGVVGGSQR